MSLTDTFLKSGFVLALGVETCDCKNTYDAVDFPGKHSWLMKAELDPKSCKLTPHVDAGNSIVLENAYVDSLVEIACDKLLVFTLPTDLLYVVDW